MAKRTDYQPKERKGHHSHLIEDNLYVWGGAQEDFFKIHDIEKRKRFASCIEVFSLSSKKWMQHPTKGDPPLAMWNYSSAAVGNDIYFFGGYFYHGRGDDCYQNSLFKLNVKTKRWTEIASYNGPMKKSKCGMVAIKINNEDRLLVIGGWGPTSNNKLRQINPQYAECYSGRVRTNEIHYYNPVADNRLLLLPFFKLDKWKSIKSTGHCPPPCDSFSLTALSDDKIILFGGDTPNGSSNDVYIGTCTASTVIWEKVSRPKDSSVKWPKERMGHAATLIDEHYLLVVGGNDTSDSWIFNIIKRTWKELVLPQTITNRTDHSLTLLSDENPSMACIIVFGGCRLGSSYINDTSIIELRCTDEEEWSVAGLMTHPLITNLTFMQDIKHKPEQKQLQQEKNQLQQEKDQLQQEKSQLQQEKGHLQQEKGQLQQENIHINKMKDELQEEYTLEKQKFHEQKNVFLLKNNQLQLENNLLNLNLGQLQRAKYQLDKDKEQLQKKNIQLQKKNDQLQEEKDQLQDEKNELQEEKDELQEKNDLLEEQKEQLQEEKDELQEEKDELQEENDQLQRDKNELQEEKDQLQEEKDQLQQEKDLLQHQLDDERSWVIKRNEIDIIDEVIGKGGWGEVKVANFRGLKVAAKCLYELIISPHNIAIFTREMEIASKVRHPNLLQFIGATREETAVNEDGAQRNSPPIILCELMPTSLHKQLEIKSLTRQQIIQISINVSCALNYLHLHQPNPILHRDVSSSNVLLEPSVNNGGWKAKLSDYGSANLAHEISSTSVGPGNPFYSAPEAKFPDNHSPAMDVYSFGVLVMEMVLRQSPSSTTAARERQADIIAWTFIKSLVKSCIKQTSTDRPSISNVLVDLKKLQK